MRYLIRIMIASLFFLSCILPSLVAQTPAPNAYTVSLKSMMTEASMFTGQTSELKVYRNGTKELVDLTIRPWKDNPKGVHYRYFFDLQARKAYTQDLNNNSCSWMNYVSSRGPVSYDPITAFDSATRAQMAKSKSMGTEVINGIAATVIESDSPQGLAKTWIAQKGDYPVKMTLQPKTGALRTMLEITAIDFNPPSPSLLNAPANCGSQTQGEWSDSGVRAQAGATLGVQASASTNLGTGKTQSHVSAGAQAAGAANADPKLEGLIGSTEDPVLTPSQAGCTVLFRAVSAETMQPIASGIEVSIDNRKVSAQYQNGVLRIENAPAKFFLEVELSSGAGYGSDLSRQCFRPETVLMLVISKELSATKWYWAKSGKYASVQK